MMLMIRLVVKVEGPLEQAVLMREKMGFTRTGLARSALWQYLGLDSKPMTGAGK